MTLTTRLKMAVPAASDMGDHGVYYDPNLQILDAEIGMPTRSGAATYTGQLGVKTGTTVNGIDAGPAVYVSTDGTTFGAGPVGRPIPLGQQYSNDSFSGISPSGPLESSGSSYTPISIVTALGAKSTYRIRVQITVRFWLADFDSSGNMQWTFKVTDSNNATVATAPLQMHDAFVYDQGIYGGANVWYVTMSGEVIARNTTVNTANYTISLQATAFGGGTFNYRVYAGGSANGETFIHCEHVGGAS